jgi:15-cis-phytoene synthase
MRLALSAEPRRAGHCEPAAVEQDSAAWFEAVGIGRQLLARKARSFHLATRLLPEDLRDDIAVLYAFCRIADDLADESDSPELADVALSRLEAELLGAQPQRAVISALRGLARRRGFPLSHARALLEGVRSDLRPARIENDVQLLDYSYLVASTVGLMLNHLLGVVDPEAEPHAIDLGLAMQLTNIVRDVREDAERGRVYLPHTRLTAHGITPEQVIAGTASRGALRDVCLEVLELADRYYASAEQGFRFIPLRARFGVAVAARVYAAIGRRIRRTGHHPLDGRMVVPGPEKLGRIGQAVAVTLRSSITSGLPLGHDRRLHLALRIDDSTGRRS